MVKSKGRVASGRKRALQNNAKKSIQTLKNECDKNLLAFRKSYEKLCSESGIPPDTALLRALQKRNVRKIPAYLTSVYREFFFVKSVEPCALPKKCCKILDKYPLFRPKQHLFFQFYVYQSEKDFDENRPCLYKFIAPQMLVDESSETDLDYKSQFVHATVACMKASVKSSIERFRERSHFRLDKPVNIAFFSKLMKRSIGISETSSRRWYELAFAPAKASSEKPLLSFQDCSSNDRFQRLKNAIAHPVSMELSLYSLLLHFLALIASILFHFLSTDARTVPTQISHLYSCRPHNLPKCLSIPAS